MAMNESYEEHGGRAPDAEFDNERRDYTGREQQQYASDPPPRRRRGAHKSVAAAAFLSMLPGAGQVYIGAYARGLAHALTFAGIITILANGMLFGLEPFLGISLAFFVIYNLVDAIRLAQAYNDAVDSGKSMVEPLEISTTYGRGVGIALVVIGTLILMETRFDLDMRWVREWWPLAIILVGVGIIRNSMKKDHSEA